VLCSVATAGLSIWQVHAFCNHAVRLVENNFFRSLTKMKFHDNYYLLGNVNCKENLHESNMRGLSTQMTKSGRGSVGELVVRICIPTIAQPQMQ
jgi:hypothetical protein